MNVWHEVKQHGDLSFPFTVYKVEVPNYLSAYPLHWHDEMELIFVKSGQGTVTVESHNLHVRENDIVIIPPQTVHAIEQLEDYSMEYYNILFSFNLLCNSDNDVCYDSFLGPLYTHQLIPPLVAESGSELNECILGTVNKLVDLRHISNEKRALGIKGDLFSILQNICDASSEITWEEKNLKNNYEKLKDLLLYVQSNYDKEITVADAAEICAFSESHFMKLFKDLSGKSFAQYLIDYRLERAYARIASTDEKISNIAFDCGFNNLSYFTRKFC